MPVNKIVTKVDGVINKTINFNDLKAGLAAGSHTITVEAYNGATLISTQTKNITIAEGAAAGADYQAVLDYATAQSIDLPDSAQQSIDNQLLIDYKATGAWVKDDCFMKFTGTATPAFKLIDWKRLITMVAYGSLTWSTTGAKGNGANAYIDTKYIASATGNKWVIDNAGIMVGLNSFGTTSGSFTGAKDIGGPQTRLYISQTDDDYFTINNVGASRNNLILGLNGLYLNATDTDTAAITDDTILTALTAQTVPEQELYLFAWRRDNIAQLFTDVEITYVTYGADKRAEHAAMKTVLE